MGDELLNVAHHFSEKGEGKNHYCMVCLEKWPRLRGGDGGNVSNASKTTFKCAECDVYLRILKEPNCFTSLKLNFGTILLLTIIQVIARMISYDYNLFIVRPHKTQRKNCL